MTGLYVYLFGGFRLEKDDAPLPPIPSRVGRSLFAYLITYRDQRHTRNLLAGLFWPDMPDARARRRLSQALWQIRRVLNPTPSSHPYILVDAEAIQFNSEVSYWLDVEVFERKLKEAGGSPLSSVPSLRTAVTLYAGDFLAGYYHDWAVTKRERLRDMYLTALNRLVRLCKAQGDYEEALAYAHQLTLQDPLREEAHREVMRLYYLLERPNDALQQYDLCRSLLGKELGINPSPTTTALYRDIQARLEEEHPPPTFRLPPSPLLEGKGPIPLIGRERERAALVSAVEQALGGRGGLVLVEGEAGVGKTRLLQELAQDAVWRGMSVLWGRGRELAELPPPYRVLHEALEGGLSPLRAGQLAQSVAGVWLREVSRLLPQLTEWLPDLPPHAPLGPTEERGRLLEALTRTVLALGRITPHLLIMEDLQWTDEETLQALRHLARRLGENPVLIVVSYRSQGARERGPVWETLRELEQAGGARRLILARLSSAEAGELVQRGLGLVQAAPRFEARLHQETGGNPLFVLETLRALHDQGALYRDETGAWNTPWDETTAGYTELPLSPRLQRVIAGRLARLSPATRAVLNAAVVLGDDFDLPTLAQASVTSDAEVLEAVDALLRRGLIVGEAAYRFSHDKIRQVAYLEIDETERQRLHRRAGQLLEAQHPEQVEALAHHFTRGRAWDKAVRYHRQAGERAAVIHAYPTALHHYTQAVNLAGAAPLSVAVEQRYELLAAREAILDVLGRRQAQAADLEAMSQLVHNDPRRLAAVHCRRAWLLAYTSRFDQAEAAAREALTLAEQAGDEAGQGAALTALGTTLDWRGNAAQAVQHLAAAVAIERRRGDPRREAKARCELAYALHDLQQYADALAELDAALALYQTLKDRLGQAEILDRMGLVHWQLGDVVEAETCLRHALEICRAIGYRYGEAHNLVDWGNVLYFQGKVGEALQRYDEAVAICQQIGSLRGEAIARTNAAEARYLSLGDDERAQTDAELALIHFREVGDQRWEAQCLGILGGIALRRGQRAQARRYLEAGLAKSRAVEDRWCEAQVLCQPLVLLDLEEGRPNRALARVKATEATCAELGLADIGVRLRALRGVVLLALGRPEEALAATRQAVSQLTAGVYQPYLIHFWHHQALTALNQPGEARRALEGAYQALQATWQGLSAEQRQQSRQQVPEHRAIVEAWEATNPRRLPVRLPHADAPTGRPLRDDERVEVAWTLAVPEDETIPGKKARRQHRLLRLLGEAAEQGAAPTVNDLAAALDVSQKTIKRDLAALRQAGHDVRTRGTR